MDLNKVMIIGRLTRDPEIRTTTGGQNVASFSVATNRQWKDQNTGEKKSVTEYHNCVAWRRLAEIVGQYLTKGRQIYVEGHLQTRSWDDQTGQKKYRTEIVCDNMIMLGGRGDAPQGDSSQASAPHNMAQQGAAPAPMQDSGNDAPPPPQPDSDEETISVEDIPF
ncbi:MAG: single-stranded DNA-binding protein [Candidatus Kerfeldbacteria bacterium]